MADLDDFLRAMDEPEVQRRPLASGANIWQRLVAVPDKEKNQATYRKQVANGPVLVCGRKGCSNTFQVHPRMVLRRIYCSKSCREADWYQAHSKNDGDFGRPKVPQPGEPWKWRERKRD